MAEGPYRMMEYPTSANAMAFNAVVFNHKTARVVAICPTRLDGQLLTRLLNRAEARARVNLARRVQGKRP